MRNRQTLANLLLLVISANTLKIQPISILDQKKIDERRIMKNFKLFISGLGMGSSLKPTDMLRRLICRRYYSYADVMIVHVTAGITRTIRYCHVDVTIVSYVTSDVTPLT